MGVSDTDQVSIAHYLNCQIGSFPLTYLGIPLKFGKLCRADWQPLLDRIEKRLDGRKDRSLSCARLVLINVVLSALPSYYMSFFNFPPWLVHRIWIKLEGLFLVSF